jgi:hypothetical protein
VWAAVYADATPPVPLAALGLMLSGAQTLLEFAAVSLAALTRASGRNGG